GRGDIATDTARRGTARGSTARCGHEWGRMARRTEGEDGDQEDERHACAEHKGDETGRTALRCRTPHCARSSIVSAGPRCPTASASIPPEKRHAHILRQVARFAHARRNNRQAAKDAKTD